MAFKRIDHVAIEVSDLQRSVAFYVRNFGFEHYFDQKTGAGLSIAYLKLGGTVLELVGRRAEAMAGFHFCLIADDFDQAVADITAASVPVAMAPHPTAAREPAEAGWRRVVFAGPDGEQIEIRG